MLQKTSFRVYDPLLFKGIKAPGLPVLLKCPAKKKEGRSSFHMNRNVYFMSYLPQFPFVNLY